MGKSAVAAVKNPLQGASSFLGEGIGGNALRISSAGAVMADGGSQSYGAVNNEVRYYNKSPVKPQVSEVRNPSSLNGVRQIRYKMS